MPEVRDYFSHIAALDLPALHARRDELLRSSGGNYASLPDEVLAELLAINRALRKKAAAPGGGGRKAKTSAEKQQATRESLA